MKVLLVGTGSGSTGCLKTRAKRAQELPEGSGLIFGFQVSNVDCLPEAFPGFCGSFQGLVL
jgi:hypothetical protein